MARKPLPEIKGFRIEIGEAGFKGINLFEDSTKTRDEDATQIENMRLYDAGNYKSVVRRNGIARYNTNAPAGATAIRSVYEYISKSKNTNFTRLLVKTGSTLAYCVGTGAFNDILTGLADCKMRFATYEDNCYIVNNNNGADKNYFYDGTNIVEHGIIPTPQSFKLAESTGGGTGLPNGDYLYLITYLYDGDQESFPVMSTQLVYPDEDSNSNGAGGYYGVPKLILNNRKITVAGAKPVVISNIPTGNGRVTARKIYRTKVGATAFYYHSTINDNSTTTLIDAKQDGELTEVINVDYIFKPMNAKRSCVHKGKLWLANLKENMYGTAPEISAVTGTSSYDAANGNLTVDGAASRQAKYTYKFAKIYIITLTSGSFGLPYTGYIGKKSAGKQITMTTAHNKIALDNIDNTDVWTQRVAIFRNTCQFISGISVSGTTLTVTILGDAEAFKDGETIVISGVSGFSENPNGNFVIRECDYSANTFKITFNTNGGSYSANTGVCEGGTFYYLGLTALMGSTNGDTFVDTIGDTDLVLADGILKDFIVKEQDDTFASGLMHSVAGKGDVFETGGARAFSNYIDVFPNDNCEIKEIVEIYGGVYLIKENGPCTISTDASSSSNWIPRKIPIDTGATDDDNINSFVKIGNNEYIFMSNNVFYHIVDGRLVNASEKIQSDLDGLALTNLDGTYYEKKKTVIYNYSTSGIAGNEIIYDLNERDQNGTGQWYYNPKGSYDLGLCAPMITKGGVLLYGNSVKPGIFTIGTGYQDTVWDSSGGGSFVNVSVTTKWQSKIFQEDNLLLRRILGEVYSSGSGSMTIYYYDSTGAEVNIVITLAAGNNFFNSPVNSRATKQRVRIETAMNRNFIIRSINLDFRNLHRGSGKK